MATAREHATDQPSPLGSVAGATRPSEARPRPRPRRRSPGKHLDAEARALILRLKGESPAAAVARLARVSVRTVYRVWGGGPKLHQLTDAERAEVIRRHAAGEGTRTLAGEYGVTQRTVQGAVKRARDAAGRG